MKRIIKYFFTRVYPIREYALLAKTGMSFDWGEFREWEVRWFDTKEKAETWLKDSVPRRHWEKWILLRISSAKQLNFKEKWVDN